MKKETIKVTTIEQFKEKLFGKRGTKKREDLEAGYEKFRAEAKIKVAGDY